MAQRQRSGDALLGASRCRAEERGGPSEFADRQQATVRAPVETPVRAVGGELVPAEDFAAKTLPAILDTLVNPDAVAADASRDRLDLAKNAGVLELALDTADTIQAGDALERMLAHQMATTHTLAMKAAAIVNQQLDLADRTMGTAKQAARAENMMSGGLNDILPLGVPEVVGKMPLLERVLGDLKREDLLESARLNTTMSAGGLLAKRTSQVGDTFLQFIASPIEDH